MSSQDLASASDADLARALLAQEPAAFRVAWQRFMPLVRGMAGRAFGRGAETEEVVQEIFFCFFRRVSTLRDPVALRAFVMAVASRTLSHERRRRRPRLLLVPAGEDQIAKAPGLSLDPTANQAFLRFRELVLRLRQREREAFVLRYVEGMDADEVAGKLGVSTPTARRSFRKARQRIDLWAGRDSFLSEYVQHGAEQWGREALA
ncbi:MAG TPA: sigma-70 family RNA polymerase sigma factor [Polyangiaceae bacterium]|nr:sigma-70 family RNA polymerase sigma factor [Polyangiaceae bacterium]